MRRQLAPFSRNMAKLQVSLLLRMKERTRMNWTHEILVLVKHYVIRHLSTLLLLKNLLRWEAVRHRNLSRKIRDHSPVRSRGPRPRDNKGQETKGQGPPGLYRSQHRYKFTFNFQLSIFHPLLPLGHPTPLLPTRLNILRRHPVDLYPVTGRLRSKQPL